MQKNRFQYYIKGYRYAPESFHAFKGLSGHRPVEIPLSDSQRQQMGYLCVTQSGKAAIDYVKRIERARARKPKSFVTYGFQVREDPRRYVYAPSLRCRPDAPFALDGGRVEQLTECKLDGRFRPANVRRRYVTADLNRPVVVHLRAA